MKRQLWCSVCGETSFSDKSVIWDALAAEWELAPHERAYVDRQQGTACRGCGCNLRSIALSNAIRSAVGTDATLQEFVRTQAASRLSILEVNEAGGLTPILRNLPGRVFARYPEVDMQALPYEVGSFDLILHSDTLEHVSQPLLALAECKRVLRLGGTLCFTIPIIVGRLSRSRAGLPPSYHGDPSTGAEDFLVQTEFGVDAWTYLIQAGFEATTLNVIEFPSAIAISAKKPFMPGIRDEKGSRLENARSLQAPESEPVSNS
jgi:SAM-dependent methyltransferase